MGGRSVIVEHPDGTLNLNATYENISKAVDSIHKSLPGKAGDARAASILAQMQQLPDMITFLNKGSGFVQDNLKAGAIGVTTADQIKAATEFQASLGRAGVALDSFTNVITEKVEKFFQLPLDMFTSFVAGKAIGPEYTEEQKKKDQENLKSAASSMGTKIAEAFIPSLKKIGRASCRERVSSPV